LAWCGKELSQARQWTLLLEEAAEWIDVLPQGPQDGVGTTRAQHAV
jgi:hypothetical protein